MNIKHLLSDLLGKYSIEISTYSLDLGILYDLHSKMKLPDKNRYLHAIHDPAKLRSFRSDSQDAKYEGLSFKCSNIEKLFHPKIWNFYRGNITKAALISSGNLSKYEMDNQINFSVILEADQIKPLQINKLVKSKNYELNLDKGILVRRNKSLIRSLTTNLNKFCNPTMVICSSEIYSKSLLKKIIKIAEPRECALFMSKSNCAPVARDLGQDIKIQMFEPQSDMYHGKLLFINDNSRALLYLGSSNFTKAGYGDYAKKHKQNVETGIIINSVTTKGIDFLKVSVRQLLKGTWKRVKHPCKDNKDPDSKLLFYDTLKRHMITALRVDKNVLKFPKVLKVDGKKYYLTEFTLYNNKMSYSWNNKRAKYNKIFYQGWTPETSIQFRIKSKARIFTAFLPPLSDSENIGFNTPDRSILDMLNDGPFCTQRRKRNKKASICSITQEDSHYVDVRFPWHILGELNEYAENSEWKKLQMKIIENEINQIRELKTQKKKIAMLEIAKKVLENI